MSDRKYISKVISNGETYHVKDKEIRDSLGQVNGIATLGSDGKVSPSQLPTDIDTTYQFSQSGNSLQVGVNGGAKDTVYTPTITKSTVGLDNVTNDAQVKRTEMGAASGVATLDDNGKVPASQLPSYVDDVLEYADRSSFPQTGETGKIYVDKSTNITWRWGGSDYVEISPSLALGETSSTAYAGDKGKALADKLSGIESGAQVHRAPTTAEVKSALGTGSGTIKYLREDGTWATPPNSQYSFVDKDTTLDWGTRSTVATAGDVDIHVTMPSNPNTNTARLQVSDTANKRINTKESTGNYLQFTGGTNKFSVSDGTNTFDVGITPSVSFPVTSVVGQTGEVTVSQIASALTGAGYKLTDTIYSLPAATSNTLGGIKTGYTTDARNYKVSLDSNSNAYVNVPWSDTTYSAGTGISLSGTTFGINSTYQDYISHGNTAYGWGNHANAGYITSSGSCAYASSAGSVAWSNITGMPTVVTKGGDGVVEVGQYLDFHKNETTSDYSTRIEVLNNNGNTVYLPSSNGTLALTSDLGSYLPLSGGTISGASEAPLTISTSTGYSAIIFRSTEGYRVFGIKGDGNLFVTPYSNWNAEYHIYHTGNLTNISQLANDSGYITGSGSCAYASSAGSVAWSDVIGKPINFKAYSGSLSSGGWAALQGMGNEPSIAISYNTSNAPWNSGTYSATLVYGNGDTRGMLDCAYNNPVVSFGGGWYSGATNDSPAWYMKITGSNATAYNLNSMPYAVSAGNADTLDGYHYNGLPYLPVAQVAEEQNNDNPNWVRSYAVNHRQSLVYNTSGREWAYWIGMRSSDTGYGTILRLSHDGLVQYMYKAGGGDSENWSDWKDIITQNNIGSQAVNYASYAGQLNTPRTIWGQSFDGSGNIVGHMTFDYGESHFMHSGGTYDDPYPGYNINFKFGGSLAATSLSTLGNAQVAGTLTTGNITSQGVLTVSTGADSKIILDNNDNETYWSIISFRDHGSEYGWLGTGGSTDLKWNGNVVIHSGNITSQYVSHADSADNAEILKITGYGDSCLTYYQTSEEFDGYSGGWCHYIIANHGDGASYYHYTIGLPFSDVPMYRRQTGSTSSVTPWYRFITEENIGSQSVNYATSAGNADTVDGYHAYAGNNNPYGTIPVITDSGYMDVGRHFEFHYDNTTGSDYSTALCCTGNYSNIVNLPSSSGTLALTSDIPTTLPASDVYSWAKASSKPSYSWSEISDKPTTMPASDVYSWAKASSKPSYSWSEISDKPTIPTVGQINYLTSNADIYPQYGLNVLIKMPTSGRYINLPPLSQCQSYTGTSGSQKFALIVRIACHTSGSAFTLYGYRGTYATTQYPHIRSGSTADRTTGVDFSAGDTDTYMLTYDGNIYEAYRLCYTE